MTKQYLQEEKNMLTNEKTDAWVNDTFQYLSEHPDIWPTELEMPIDGTPFWACIRIGKVFIHGEQVLDFDAVCYRGPKAEIEMSMTMESGNEETILAFIREQLDRGCSKPKSYLETVHTNS